MRYPKLYFHLLRFAFIRNLAYPKNFIVWTIVDIFWSAINLGFFRVLLFNIPDISGWKFNQLILPLGIVHLLSAFIWGMMYSNMKEIPQDINKGNLDLSLTKPLDSQFLLSSRYLGLNLFPTFIIGSFLVWYGLTINNLLTLPKLFIILISLISAIIISYSLWFIIVTLSFWFNRLLNIAELFPHSLDIARYPVNIFPPLVRFIFTFILPFAFLGFLPAEIILGRTPLIYILGPILAAIILLILSHSFWLFALRHYSSASS